jgi:glycerate dehydrogenase
MKLVLLDAQTLGEDLDLAPLKEFGELITYPITTEKETAVRIQNAEVVITNKVIIDRTLMEQAKQLKLICIAATGMNNVDLEAAKELGITVKNVAGYSTQSVTQHTFATALYLIEKLDYYNQVVKSKLWSNQPLFTDVSRPYFEIAGKQWGIVGMGSIGQEVAQIATAFGATVSYHSTSGNNTDQPYTHKSLEALLRESDILSIHAPLNPQTLNLINQNNLPLLRKGAILLNMGRGGIVNEIDLAAELDRRELYAGLDVSTKEPIEADHPLLHLVHPDRLLLTPHIAWASIEARKKLLAGIVENIRSSIER